jgi:hypothetical protein
VVLYFSQSSSSTALFFGAFSLLPLESLVFNWEFFLKTSCVWISDLAFSSGFFGSGFSNDVDFDLSVSLLLLEVPTLY